MREVTLRSSPTMSTKRFSGPVCTACAGTTVALTRVRGAISTFTYMPGHRRACGLANSAFTRMVPVVVSTALSTNVSWPVYFSPSCAEAPTDTGPVRSACCNPGSSFSGSVNDTAMGSICEIVTSTAVLGWTRLPARTPIAPVRPEHGARISV